MSARMEITGDEEIVRKLRALGKTGEDEAEAAVNAMSQRVRTHAIKSIQRSNSTGVTYEKYKPRRTHTASAPNNPPNTDTGALVRSIKAIVSGMAGKVGTDLEYAYFLEIGTQAMEERPWLWPAVEANQAWYLDRMQEALDRAVERVSI
jgi:HK97 gp10 family phage protein